jgi:hypothetical protein
MLMNASGILVAKMLSAQTQREAINAAANPDSLATPSQGAPIWTNALLKLIPAVQMPSVETQTLGSPVNVLRDTQAMVTQGVRPQKFEHSVLPTSTALTMPCATMVSAYAGLDLLPMEPFAKTSTNAREDPVYVEQMLCVETQSEASLAPVSPRSSEVLLLFPAQNLAKESPARLMLPVNLRAMRHSVYVRKVGPTTPRTSRRAVSI